MAQSALIVPVGEAEAVVGEIRNRFDPTALLGVPAHITTIFPFADPSTISGHTIDGLRSATASIRAFAFQLRTIGQFPTALYLNPEPSDRFVALTSAIVDRFPEFPPYGGQFSSVVPHLTVAYGESNRLAGVREELERAIGRHGPISSFCSSLTLIENSTGRWLPVQEIPLASQRPVA